VTPIVSARTQDLHPVEPSTDFPTLEEVPSCPQIVRVSRRCMALVAVTSALVAGVIGFALGRAL
jgi:hypothetical protein